MRCRFRDAAPPHDAPSFPALLASKSRPTLLNQSRTNYKLAVRFCRRRIVDSELCSILAGALDRNGKALNYRVRLRYDSVLLTTLLPSDRSIRSCSISFPLRRLSLPCLPPLLLTSAKHTEAQWLPASSASSCRFAITRRTRTTPVPPPFHDSAQAMQEMPLRGYKRMIEG